MNAEIEMLREQLYNALQQIVRVERERDTALKECRKQVLLETAMYLRDTDWIPDVWQEIIRIAEEETA